MLVLEMREFESRLTEWMGLVESGSEDITIMRGSDAIAILTGVRTEDDLEGKVAALKSIRRGNGERFSTEWAPVKCAGKPASDIILEERAERF